MKGHYTRTVVGMVIVLGVLVSAALISNSIAADSKDRHEKLLQEECTGLETHAAERDKVRSFETAMKPVREFAAAWKGDARVSDRDAADKIRSDIEAIAQRQLALVTDGAITPQPDRYLFRGMPFRVQRVSLRASGKDLAGLITWLGKVEERYPAAIIEHCDFTTNVGGNTALTLRLVQPLKEAGSRPAVPTTPLRESTLLPYAIAAQPWHQYLPAKVKGAIPVGFQRNPLQPTIKAEARALPLANDGSDEVTPRLEQALDGRVRSVIRGASPVVVIDGRIFRVGDEITIGSGREKPVPEARTKLKQVGADQLVFRVAGGGENPIQCDAVYPLPPFLHVR